MYTIRQVAELTGFSPDTLRYYEKIGLLKSPQRGSGGVRTYSDDNVHLLISLNCLKKTGLSLEDINATSFLSGDDSEAKKVVAQLSCDIGLDPVDVGGSENMEKIETAMGTLWRILSPKFGREYSFRILRRDTVTKNC